MPGGRWFDNLFKEIAMQSPDSKIRAPRGTSLALAAILMAAFVAPVAMLAGFPWVSHTQIEEIIGVSRAEASQPAMVFEPELITLAEADATVAAANAAAAELDDEVEPTFTSVCDPDPLANAPVAALDPNDVAEPDPSYR